MEGNENTRIALDCRHKETTHWNERKGGNRGDDSQYLGSCTRSRRCQHCFWLCSRTIGKRPLSPILHATQHTSTWCVRSAIFATKRYSRFVSKIKPISSRCSDFYQWTKQQSQTFFLKQKSISWKRRWFYSSDQAMSITSWRNTGFLPVVASSSWRHSSTSWRGDRRHRNKREYCLWTGIRLLFVMSINEFL